MFLLLVTRVTGVAVLVAQDLRWATYTHLIATRTISARISKAQAVVQGMDFVAPRTKERQSLLTGSLATPIVVVHTMLL